MAGRARRDPREAGRAARPVHGRARVERDAAHAVATHLRRAPVGVAHPHERPPALETGEQDAVRTNPAVTIAKALGHPRGDMLASVLDDQEVVAEAFVLLEAQLHGREL